MRKLNFGKVDSETTCKGISDSEQLLLGKGMRERFTTYGSLYIVIIAV